MQRAPLWEEGDKVMMGNTEAFVLHLGRQFGVETTANHATHLHALMRGLGESIMPHKKHAAPDPESPRAGRFKQPSPEEWSISRKPSKD